MEAAVSTYERRLAVAGASASDFAQAASAVGTLGDFQGQSGVASLGDPAAALQSYRQSMLFHERALAEDPAFVRSRRGVAIAHVKIGNILVATDPWQALEEYRASLAAWLALPAAEQSNSATRRGIAHTHFKIANALADAENYPQSIAEYEKAAGNFELQASGDPDDSRANYDLAVLYNAEALTYIDMLTPPAGASAEEQHTNAQQAIQLFRRASAILQRLMTVNPTNRSWAATLAYERTWVGWLEQTYGLATEGLQQTSVSITALIKAASEPDATVDVLDMATSARLVALPKRLRDPAWTAHYAERLVTITRRKKPAFFLTLARALRANGQSDQAREAASEGLALLPVLAPDSAMPRLNRLLHAELSAHAESPTL